MHLVPCISHSTDEAEQKDWGPAIWIPLDPRRWPDQSLAASNYTAANVREAIEAATNRAQRRHYRFEAMPWYLLVHAVAVQRMAVGLARELMMKDQGGPTGWVNYSSRLHVSIDQVHWAEMV